MQKTSINLRDLLMEALNDIKEETKDRMELTKKKHDQCKESPRRY